MNSARDLPPRPLIPLSAACAVGAVGGAACATEMAWRAYPEPTPATPSLLLAASCAIAAAVFALLFRYGPHRRPSRLAAVMPVIAMCLLGAFLGMFSGTWWGHRMSDSTVTFMSSPASAFSFTAVGDPSVGERGASSSVRADDERGSPVGRAHITLDEMLEDGEVVHGVGSVKKLGDTEWGRSRFMKGECVAITLKRLSHVPAKEKRSLLSSVRGRMLSAIEPSRSLGRALLAGVLCGRVTELSQTDASDAFSVTGLSHLIAVSGGHLALIVSLLEGRLLHARMRPRARVSLLGTIMLVYVVFTGGAPSAWRSSAMVFASSATRMMRRRPHALSGLSLAVFILVVVRPGMVWDLGFQLSVASVLFLNVFGGYATYALESLGLPTGIAEALGCTLLAQWATIPLCVPVFGSLSLISPVANLIAGPLMTALLIGGIVIVPLCVALPFAGWLVEPLALLGQVNVFTAQALAALPFSSIQVAKGALWLFSLYPVALLLYVLWPRVRRVVAYTAILMLGLSCGAYMAFWTLFAPAGVTVLDVGQADSILIRDGSRAVLVDAGVDGRVLDALARQHVFKLDALIFTHWDQDHWGGAPDILERFAVGSVIVAKGAAGHMPQDLKEEYAGAVLEMARGERVSVGGFELTAVWPDEPVEGEENEESLVLDVCYRKDDSRLHALLTGDTEAEQEREYMNRVGDIDVLKLGHHGSKVSVDAKVLDTLLPEVSIASAGEDNPYGHPSRECISAVKQAGSRFLCTKDVGDVSIYPARGSVRITTMHPQAFANEYD